jgi:hypothetical protein
MKEKYHAKSIIIMQIIYQWKRLTLSLLWIWQTRGRRAIGVLLCWHKC